jgi:polar amino acid transport system substrate-binding protein
MYLRFLSLSIDSSLIAKYGIGWYNSLHYNKNPKGALSTSFSLRTVLLIIGLTSVSLGDTLTLAADEWCPFDCISRYKNKNGFMVDIAENVFSKAGHTVVFKVMKWKFAIDSCRAGKITGIIGAQTGDAPDFVFPANDQGSISQALFTLNSSQWRYTDTASLAKVKLGCAAGYSYCPEIDQWIAENANNKSRVLVCKSSKPLDDLIPLLLNQMISAIIEETSVFQYTAKKMNLSGSFRIAGYGCTPQPGYIAFSPKIPQSPKYADMLSKGMVTLRTSGELAKIRGKYGLK